MFLSKLIDPVDLNALNSQLSPFCLSPAAGVARAQGGRQSGANPIIG